MNIPEGHLRKDFARARSWWGTFIDEAERRRDIPRRLLYAIYSRETNLGRHWRIAPPSTWPATPADDDLTFFIRNAGDGGHGRGIGQVDDRSHAIPSDWSSNLTWQIERSAEILADYLGREGGDIVRGANRYNSGQGETRYTTGKDYGPDVFERWQFLIREFPPDDAQEPPVAGLDNLHPVFAQRVAGACRARGTSVYSGARSTTRQRELWEGWQARRPGYNPANPPGTSWHEYGDGIPGGRYALAVDFDEPYPHGEPGLIFPIEGEPWHAQPVEIPEPSRVAGAENRLPEPNPVPAPQGDLHMLTFRYIFDGQDWVFDGPSSLFFQLNDPRQITEVLDPLGVKALGQVSDATHRRYSELAAAAGFKG